MNTIVEVSSLTVRSGERELISNLSVVIPAGDRLGLIGESGAGKSLTALALLGLLPRQLEVSGSILLDGVELVGAPESTVVPLRGNAASVVFQEPLTALDAALRVGPARRGDVDAAEADAALPRFMWVEATEVARAAVDGLDRGHAHVIPGAANWAAAWTAPLVPPTLLTRVVARRHPGLRDT